jgi:hypothetical protein
LIFFARILGYGTQYPSFLFHTARAPKTPLITFFGMTTTAPVFIPENEISPLLKLRSANSQPYEPTDIDVVSGQQA